MSRAATDEEILDAIYEVFRTSLGYHGDLSPEFDLIAADLDSLEILTLVVALEDRFEVAIDEESGDGVTTIGALVDMVQRVIAAT